MLIRVFALGLLLSAIVTTPTCSAKRTLGPHPVDHGRIHALPTVASSNSAALPQPTASPVHPANGTTTLAQLVHFGHGRRRNLTTTTNRPVANITELPQSLSTNDSSINITTGKSVPEKVKPENPTAVPEFSTTEAITTTTLKQQFTGTPNVAPVNSSDILTPSTPEINHQNENSLGSTTTPALGTSDLSASRLSLTDAETSSQSTISAIITSTSDVTSEAMISSLPVLPTPAVGNNTAITETLNQISLTTAVGVVTTPEPVATTASTTIAPPESHSSAQNISSLNPQPISPSIIGEKRQKRQLMGSFPGGGQFGQGMMGNFGGIQGGGAFGGAPTIVDTVQVEDIVSPGVVPGVVGGFGGMPTVVDTITVEDIVAPGLG